MRFLWQAFRMAIQNLMRNRTINLLCLGIIAFTLLVLGIFQFVSFNLNQYINHLSRNISAIFYLNHDIDPGARGAFLNEIQGSLLVQKVDFITNQEAMTRFINDFPDLGYILTEFQESPFPDSFEVKFREAPQAITQIEAFIKEIKKSPLVESVQLNTDWAKKIEAFKRFITSIGVFLTFILLFVSIFVIFNVIKLNILYRKEEIVIFQMVGATNLFIRLPFLIEGLLLGLSGGIVACLLLSLSLNFFTEYGGYILEFVRGIVHLGRIPSSLLLRLIIVGSLIGFFSSLVSLKRFLQQQN